MDLHIPLVWSNVHYSLLPGDRMRRPPTPVVVPHISAWRHVHICMDSGLTGPFDTIAKRKVVCIGLVVHQFLLFKTGSVGKEILYHHASTRRCAAQRRQGSTLFILDVERLERRRCSAFQTPGDLQSDILKSAKPLVSL